MSTATIQSAQPEKKQRSTKNIVLPLLLVLLGVVVMLYPVVASQWNNYQQLEIARKYESDVTKAEPKQLHSAVEKAKKYNEDHAGQPILDPWLSRISEDNEDYQAYLEELDGQSAMSQVVIPSINSRLPVFHGTDPKTLQRGVGHLYGSALPVGGAGMRTVLTGHTGLSNATLWDNLIDMKKGDEVFVTTFGETMKYKVHGIEVVLPDETESLEAKPGKDLLSLITCTPYGINSHRLLVHAHRVPLTENDTAKLEETGGFIMQWWMWLVIALAILLLLMVAWWARRQARAAKNEEGRGDDAQAV